VKFRRNYDDLHFRVTWSDGGGMVPGPTGWNVRVLAVVPAAELDLWIGGLSAASDPQLDWIPDIPTAPPDLGGFEWFTGPGVTVGIDRKNRTVFYWNWAT
jgi:hypothetical protein